MADNSLYLSTTGDATTVILTDLGARTITHPTTNLDLTEEFSLSEIAGSQDIKDALSAGYITLRDWNNRSVPSGSVEERLEHNAQSIKSIPVTSPVVGDDNKLLSYDHVSKTFLYRGAAAAGNEPPDSTSADAGLLWYNPIQNINYLYDNSRQKWLANHNMLLFSRTSGNGTFMNIAGAADRGYKMTANITIVAAHVWYYSGTDGKIYYIYKNETSVASMPTVSRDYVSFDLDLDFDVDDEIRVYIGSGGSVGNSVCVLECAFRYDMV